MSALGQKRTSTASLRMSAQGQKATSTGGAVTSRSEGDVGDAAIGATASLGVVFSCGGCSEFVRSGVVSGVDELTDIEGRAHGYWMEKGTDI